MSEFDLSTFNIEVYDDVLSRGLCFGIGDPSGQMCIEAAICYTLGLPHGDDPECVEYEVRTFKIGLNDSHWSSPEARAKGLRDLGIAQLGSKGVVSGLEFKRLVKEKIGRKLLPHIFRALNSTVYNDLAESFETGDLDDAIDKARIIATDNTFWALSGLLFSVKHGCWDISGFANKSPNNRFGDFYLLMAAEIALEVLKELGSPGCSLLTE